MHTIIKKMKELKQLKEEASSGATDTTDEAGRSRQNIRTHNKKKAKKTSKRRRTFMQDLKQRREAASSTETDDSSLDSAGAVRSRHRSRRISRTSKHHSSEVTALLQEIRKQKCTEDQMEKYQLRLEKDYRKLQRQLLATDFSKQMTEMRNRELQSEMRDILEDQLRFDNRIIHGAKPMDQKEQDYLGEIGLLEIENRILRQKLERCEQSLLESSQQSLSECRHQSLLNDIRQQPENTGSYRY